ncbi:energy transducer TonB [Halieaceae bacterium IMCC14734]|uniref:Energy transducer TonB n=1 Tax=Candidatus Litorirhabdus singularis TaxID=2518993 RepID=A0ABT3TE38_9GAMM|nr:energy transducer TonB [Candidatus Litorirhabdus singularis]MCX2980090.1 energy transducer TonB [Candidatus Litorirhabdus singularis]
MNNNFVRLFIGAVFAVPVAGGLFFIMQYLISSADLKLDEDKIRKVADIHMPERDIDTNVAEAKPDKPDDPDEPPPDLDTPDLDMDMNLEAVNMAPAGKMNVAIQGTGGLSASDGEYLPIVKVAPIYPRRAQSRGIEGYCIIEYVVTKSGSIRDPVAVDCQPSGIFNKASLKASLKFKYKPRVVDGEAIEVAGVQNKFTYELEK